MKKKDKVKGGFRMAAGLLLTVCMIFAGALLGGAMTVEATEGGEPAESIGKTSAPTIDSSMTGSITIHKYEYDKNDGATGTGKPGDSVPTDAKALENAGFTIYKVRDADELKAIYQGISAGTMPQLSDYCKDNEKELKDGSTLTPYEAEKKTGSDGIVKFEDLPVGIYLVVETNPPKNVTTRSDAFFVSIPTTIDDNDNSKWLYDVHVFPKNAMTYSKKVTLFKEGSDGTKLKGVTFKLQQKKEEKGENGEDIWEDVDTLTTDDPDGKIEVSNLPAGTYRFVETDIGANAGYIGDYSKTYEFVVNEDGEIEKIEGYNDAVDNYIKLNADGSATITVINEKPDVDKEVKKGDGWAQEADYNIGDTITYRIKIRVPANIEKLKKFEVKDTPNGIQYTTGSLKVYEAKADGTMDATKEITEAGNYTVTAGTPTDGFTVAFTPTGAIKDHAGETIYITYDAVLQSTAVSATEEVKAGNTNTVELVYSKYIKPTGEPDDPPPPDETIEDKAVVYTFQLDIEKTGKDGNDTVALEGVTFDLYRAATADEKNNTNITKVTGTAAKALGLDEDEEWIKVNDTALTTDENGKVSQPGLANGTYYLVETKTQDGYNLLSEPIKVELSTEYITTYVSPGNPVIKHVIAENGISIKQSIELKDNNKVVTKVEILNTKGFTLPTTGGAGGFLFAVIGCAVMIVGIILFKKTKKKPESE